MSAWRTGRGVPARGRGSRRKRPPKPARAAKAPGRWLRSGGPSSYSSPSGYASGALPGSLVSAAAEDAGGAADASAPRSRPARNAGVSTSPSSARAASRSWLSPVASLSAKPPALEPAAAPEAAAAPDAPAAQGGGDAHARFPDRRRAAGPDDSGSPATSPPGASAPETSAPGAPPSAASSREVSVPEAAMEAGAAARAAKPRVPVGGRARAASRRAQSWKIGHAANDGERQYASWWASARGAGRGSA